MKLNSPVGFGLGWIIGWYLVGIYRMFVETHLPIWFHIIYFTCGALAGIIIATTFEKREIKNESN